MHMGKTLLQKVWDLHTVRQLPTGQTQLFIGLHLVHEVTSPQAFDMLRRGLQRGTSGGVADRGGDASSPGSPVLFPNRTFATVDHIVPTLDQRRPFLDVLAEEMISSLERNCREYGIPLYNIDSSSQGIVHVIGPELGLTQPGMTIACGDSHTSTHGALGAVAFGIGTSQVRDVLASQCLALEPMKVRRIKVTGPLARGVYAKDVILEIIRRLGVKGGVGFAYEYAGDTIERMTMDERMTICNMSIEGGARVGYVNPDATTFTYLEGRQFAPKGDGFTRARAWWTSIATDADARVDDEVVLRASEIEPNVTWGINPGQSIGISERIPSPGDAETASIAEVPDFKNLPDAAFPQREGERASIAEALEFMDFRSGQPIAGTRIDVAFIGSCTNARLSDLREAARIARGHHVAPHVKALVVPGSQGVRMAAEREGLDRIFVEAGFEWRGAGCSMCLAMNPDRLEGRQICASSSNRNFKGRQGSPTGRTLLMSPAMVAAAAIAGEVTDVRKVLEPATVGS
jgi:3-isopropylmalate/(R)-2-methylmalate dehydratase large subunit